MSNPAAKRAAEFGRETADCIIPTRCLTSWKPPAANCWHNAISQANPYP